MIDFNEAADRLLSQRKLGLALTTLFLIGVLILDFRTGMRIGSSLLYAAPVFLASLYLSFRWSCALALMCGAIWFGLNALPRIPASPQPLVLVWNALTRTGFFLLTVALAHVYRHMREAERLTDLKSKMLSIVSHDLNNFTTVLKMAVAILEDTEEDAIAPNRAAAYEAITNNVEKIASTVRSFLDMARLESGSFELHPKHLLLRDFTRAMVDGFAFALSKKAITLDLDFPEQPLPVRADPDVMTMVLGNLLSNAIKYTPQGGRVTVRLRQLDTGRAQVAIEDTGVGIPAEDQKKIFSGFYRTQIGKSVAAGHGLGLKLTKEMVALHGGSILVESSPGKGSRFYFSLPLWEGPAPARQFFTHD
ncbi:MAG: hypothetical protein A2506_04555 [Elusimicrobia bacterium RIFOXYD12_FULL_66_9]|nr:MAG: hypothetical protein A2506_04555 [Elusimicrobia bacterium RIFOXYD12_FULL_66_9]